MRVFACSIAVTMVVAVGAQTPRASLTGIAIMPADTFAPGPPSGAWTIAGKEGTPQFPSQPVQGFSALWPRGTDRFWALADNGFGTKLNSADALLRIYSVRVEWAIRAEQGSGRVVIEPGFVQLSDPSRKLPFPIVRGEADRLLTGADFDSESLVAMPDGSFWIGDEFGPFLLHVDGQGRVLERPREVGDIRSPDHPHLPPADAGAMSAARVARSRGFEALAAGPAFATLFAAFESPVIGMNDGTRVYRFDAATSAFGQALRYPLDGGAVSITELIGLENALGPRCAGQFLSIERDNGHGPEAKLKRVYVATIAGDAFVKELVVDLLDIENGDALGGFGPRFTFPYITTEAVWPIDDRTLVVVNDNNFPAGGGRPGAIRDATEFIRLRLDRVLCSAAM